MTAALKSNISRSFPTEPLGSAGKKLRQLAEMIGDGTELDLVSAWPDMVDVLLASKSEDLPGHIMFLDGEAWRALLPAWMMAAMRAGEGERSLRLLGAVLAVLDPHFTAKTPEIFLERTAGLTEAQRVAISDFVSWASQHPMLKDDPRSKPEVARLRVAWPQNHPAPALKS